MRLIAITLSLVAAVALAACGGGEAAKPFVDEASRAAARAEARQLARDAAAAGERAAESAAASADASNPILDRLEKMVGEEAGAREAICHRLDLAQVQEADTPAEAYEALGDLVPMPTIFDVYDSLDQLGDGDAEALRTLMC
jgi:hypothetical protein